jgi:hypothetical protein
MSIYRKHDKISAESRRDNWVNLVTSGLSTQLQKYQIELEGIARSLSGAIALGMLL